MPLVAVGKPQAKFEFFEAWNWLDFIVVVTGILQMTNV